MIRIIHWSLKELSSVCPTRKLPNFQLRKNIRNYTIYDSYALLMSTHFLRLVMERTSLGLDEQLQSIRTI